MNYGQKNQPYGVAGLDEQGKLFSDVIPSPSALSRNANLVGFSFSSSSPLLSNGDIDLSTAKVKQLNNIISTGAQITGFTNGNTYKINAILNVELPNAPSSYNLTYQGTVNDTPNFKYALNNTNATATNGFFNNGVYATQQQNGTLSSVPVNIGLAIPNYQPHAAFAPLQCSVGVRSVSGSVYLYAQGRLTTGSKEFLYRGQSSSVITSSTSNITNIVASQMGAISSTSNPVGSSDIHVFSQDNVSVIVPSTVVNKVFYNLTSNINNTFIESESINFLGSCNGNNVAIGPDTVLLCSDTVNTKVAKLDLATGALTNGLDSPVYISQLKHGLVNETNTPTFVGIALSGTNLYSTTKANVIWLTSNISSFVPEGYNVTGLEHDPVNRKWIVTIYNEETNNSRILYSTTANVLNNFTLSAFSATGKIQTPCGGKLRNGSYAIVTSKATSDEPCVASTDGGVTWVNVTGIPAYATQVTFQCGMFIMTFDDTSSTNLYYSNTGTTFSSFALSQNMNGYKNQCIGGNLVGKVTNTTLSLCSLAQMITTNEANSPTGNVSAGGQTLLAGVSANSTITFANVNILNRVYDTVNNRVIATGVATSVPTAGQNYIAIRIANVNYGESVFEIGAMLADIGNSFRLNATATSGTVYGAYAQPFYQGRQQVFYQATFLAGANSAVKLNVSYNNGTNVLLDNSSLIIEEI